MNLHVVGSPYMGSCSTYAFRNGITCPPTHLPACLPACMPVILVVCLSVCQTMTHLPSSGYWYCSLPVPLERLSQSSPVAATCNLLQPQHSVPTHLNLPVSLDDTSVSILSGYKNKRLRSASYITKYYPQGSVHCTKYNVHQYYSIATLHVTWGCY